MTTADPSAVATVRSRVSDAEWEQCVDLAACYRLVAMYGWDDLVFTHISARVPGPEHHFLINPHTPQPRAADRGRDDRGRLRVHVRIRGRLHDAGAGAGGRQRADRGGSTHRGRGGAAVKQVTRGAGGGIAWPRLLRKLDRLDPSCRR